MKYHWSWIVPGCNFFCYSKWIKKNRLVVISCGRQLEKKECFLWFSEQNCLKEFCGPFSSTALTESLVLEVIYWGKAFGLIPFCALSLWWWERTQRSLLVWAVFWKNRVNIKEQVDSFRIISGLWTTYVFILLKPQLVHLVG